MGLLGPLRLEAFGVRGLVMAIDLIVCSGLPTVALCNGRCDGPASINKILPEGHITNSSAPRGYRCGVLPSEIAGILSPPEENNNCETCVAFLWKGAVSS